MSYGTSITEALHLVGLYAGRILRAKNQPTFLVQESTKVELVINLKTAKALGIE